MRSIVCWNNKFVRVLPKLLFSTTRKQGFASPRTKNIWLILRFKCQSQPNLSALFNCPGVHLPWDGKERLWTPLVLDKGAGFAKVVNACLHCGQGIKWMLGADHQSVFVAWEAVAELCTHCCVCQWAHNVVVGCIEGVPLVIPVIIMTSPASKQRKITSNQTSNREAINCPNPYHLS